MNVKFAFLPLNRSTKLKVLKQIRQEEDLGPNGWGVGAVAKYIKIMSVVVFRIQCPSETKLGN